MIRGTEGGVQWNVLGPGAAEVNNLTEEEEKELGVGRCRVEAPSNQEILGDKYVPRYHPPVQHTGDGTQRVHPPHSWDDV
ncbi:hypothetical protein ACRE_034900 [Hapsidospora chrysogenum ATCC 11550]|uniref:Uncharacterized protein n=1 Tax=Hapsidospora chrysogenum (strain ATCC 11550 / CBS 779.69 / DSM 880 / IAM 14645 / JCM 23072 / IMI 49137) TaxID=857340 RepID=A0A086T8M3_HAPC1|nr:hypothetical protein ACRE_034900 [Hapsidospora chrysogenum ATCC 11550]